MNTTGRMKYQHTIAACYIGYITQAAVNNFCPLLFLVLSQRFSLTLDKLAMITTVNFLVQLIVDLVCAKLVDAIGYRASAVAAHLISAMGFICLAVLPFLLSYTGILISVVLYAIGGGMIEVVISPIVESCPGDEKSAAMSLLHSFYCWGHMGVILLSTLFFSLFQMKSWPVLSFLWALLPLANSVFFCFVPMDPVTQKGSLSFRGLAGNRFFPVLIVLMVCAGAAEQAMSQWASYFAETALHLSKSVGDLAGPCLFALLMGTSRAFFGHFGSGIPLKRFMRGSAMLCFGAYLLVSFGTSPLPVLAGCGMCGLAVGIFWPGALSLAARQIPSGGTAMYAFLALAGDAGCALGPALAGMAGQRYGGLQSGLLAASVFPLILLTILAFSRSDQ